MDTTVVKGMRVLEALARAEGPMTLAQLTEALQLQKSNVHRLLSTFSQLGYVEQEPGTGRYRATLKLWEIGTGIAAGHPVRRIAMPYMHELHRATGETISLTVLDGQDVLYIDKLLSPRPLRFTTQPGTRLPAIVNPSGQAMLAFEPRARDLVERTIANDPRAAGLDPDAVMATITKIAQQGYALHDSQRTPGLTAVAAALLGRSGRAVGALTISGPAQRFGPKARDAAIEALLNVCARIAEAAGHS